MKKYLVGLVFLVSGSFYAMGETDIITKNKDTVFALMRPGITESKKFIPPFVKNNGVKFHPARSFVVKVKEFNFNFLAFTLGRSVRVSTFVSRGKDLFLIDIGQETDNCPLTNKEEQNIARFFNGQAEEITYSGLVKELQDERRQAAIANGTSYIEEVE